LFLGSFGFSSLSELSRLNHWERATDRSKHYKMSLSPPIRRLSFASSNSKREEDLINAYEAEEEKIINLLSRKLEKVSKSYSPVTVIVLNAISFERRRLN
jgi:hypothetical protein